MNKLQNLIEGINRKIKNNEQVFLILPTISDETNEKETVETRYKYLKKLYNDKVSMIHGRMNKDILNKTINDLKLKKHQ